MTLDDWLACTDVGTLSLELGLHPDRKLHLLAAALLRRIWAYLPSDHTRFAVEATEKFADGRTSADALAWARSQAARESGEWHWLARGSYDDYNLILHEWGECADCPACSGPVARYEYRVAKRGGILDGARRGIGEPAWTAAGVVFYVLAAECPVQRRDPEGMAERWARQSLFATIREVLGEDGTPDRLAPEWLTSDVLALARGTHRDQAFDRLPILADALQDAGCDDESVLWHCRRPGGHARGCWVVDLAMGVS
jgi:hypothetical protein